MFTYTNIYKGWVIVTADTGKAVSATAFKPGTHHATAVYTCHTSEYGLLHWDATDVLREQLIESIDSHESGADPMKETP